MNTVATMSAEDTLQEMCKILENMPEERRAYLSAASPPTPAARDAAGGRRRG